MATRAKTWGDFSRWCEKRGLNALPAHPWTVAVYLRWLDRRHDASVARAALDVIAREHLLKRARVPVRHPTVQSTLELIERRAETRGLRSNLFDDDILTEKVPAAPTQAENPPEPPSGKSKRRTLASAPRLVRRRER